MMISAFSATSWHFFKKSFPNIEKFLPSTIYMPNVRSIGPLKQKLQRGICPPPAIPICIKPGLFRVNRSFTTVFPEMYVFYRLANSIEFRKYFTKKIWCTSIKRSFFNMERAGKTSVVLGFLFIHYLRKNCTTGRKLMHL